MTAITDQLTTLPNVAQEHRLSIDSLRRRVRDDARLKSLGRRIGNTRCYTPDEVRVILDAVLKVGQKVEAT